MIIKKGTFILLIIFPLLLLQITEKVYQDNNKYFVVLGLIYFIILFVNTALMFFLGKGTQLITNLTLEQALKNDNIRKYKRINTILAWIFTVIVFVLIVITAWFIKVW